MAEYATPIAVIIAGIIVAARLRTLTHEVQHMRGLVVALISKKPAGLKPSGNDAIVHDARTENEEFASPTFKAGKTW